MRTWIALLAVLAVIAAALVFGLGLLDDDPDTDPGEDVPTEGDPQPEGDGPGADPSLSSAGSDTEPEQVPALEGLPVRKPLGVLLLVGVPQRFNQFLAQQLDGHPEITVHSWAAPLPDGPREGVPSVEVLPGVMSTPPRSVTLDDANIDVVVVHDLDPGLLERDFWMEVVKRVGDGRLGLLVVPSVLQGQKLLDHDVLATVLPVAKATAIEGQPVPGTLGGMAAYVPTDAGTRHPASRLVSWPSWSRRIWGQRALLETPWGTNVCYPVEETPPGAAVLLEAKPAQREALPALIAADEKTGRVLWFGGWDLGGRHAYGRGNIVADWGILLRNWAAWLAGQAD